MNEERRDKLFQKIEENTTTQPKDLEKRERDIYRQGFIDGLTSYAWWNDGVQVVGTMPTPLREVIDKVEKTWNYDVNSIPITKTIEDNR